MNVRTALAEFSHAKLSLSSHTQRGYKGRLLVFATWCEEQQLQLEQLSARHIRSFIEVVSQRTGRNGGPVKSSVVRLCAETVKVFLSWCSKEEEFEDLISPKVVTRIQLPPEVQREGRTARVSLPYRRATDAVWLRSAHPATRQYSP